MTENEYRLIRKNVPMWTARIEKLKAMGKKRDEQQNDEFEMRQAQIIVWGHHLKAAGHIGGEDDSGSMSASSTLKSSEKASAG